MRSGFGVGNSCFKTLTSTDARVDRALEDAYSANDFRAAGHRIIDMLADHLEHSLSGSQSQALPWLEPEDSLAHWTELARPTGAQSPHEFKKTIETLCAELLERSVHISNPKFMGHQICSPAPTAILAGLVTDFLNNGSGVYEMGMAGTAMEKVVIRTVAEQFGMSEAADGVMTSGGTLANLTAMLAARAIKSGGDDWTAGTHQPLAIMVSDQAHYCVDRAVRIMGWGETGVIRVPTNDHYAMQTAELPGLLAKATSEGRKVIAVVGSACSTSTGSFDDLAAISQFCKQHNLWFHVDGAHGAAVAFSSKHRHLVRGIESADSVVLDFHKMLMTPVINSAVIFKRKLESFRTFAMEADYLFAQTQDQLDEFNLAKRTFECTKTMLSAKVFSILAVHGTRLWESNIDRLHEIAGTFAELIESRAAFQLAIRPQTNIVCFRLLPSLSTAHDDAANNIDFVSELNSAIREQLVRDGEFYIVKTVLRGTTWLRCTLANPFTSADDMNGLLDRLELLAASRTPANALLP